MTLMEMVQEDNTAPILLLIILETETITVIEMNFLELEAEYITVL
jgi:hypothetical protein